MYSRYYCSTWRLHHHSYRHTSASRCASLCVCARCVFICGNENITQTKNQIHSILSIQVRKRGDLVCRIINFINFKSMLIKSELFESCWTVSHLVKWANFNPPSPYICTLSTTLMSNVRTSWHPAYSPPLCCRRSAARRPQYVLSFRYKNQKYTFIVQASNRIRIDLESSHTFNALRFSPTFRLNILNKYNCDYGVWVCMCVVDRDLIQVTISTHKSL